MYSSSEVEKRISNYLKQRKIGEGTYGEVYEAMDTSKNIVIKNIIY